MSDPKENKPKTNKPRFNLSWLYIIIAMTFAYLWFAEDGSSSNRQLSYTEFKSLVNKGYANKIVAYNDNTVDVYIKPEHVKEVFKEDYKKVGRSPFMNVEVGSIESLDKFMEQAQENGTFTGEISYEKKSDITTNYWLSNTSHYSCRTNYDYYRSRLS